MVQVSKLSHFLELFFNLVVTLLTYSSMKYASSLAHSTRIALL